MRVTDERLDDFITRWEQVFGERLTPDKARPAAVRLLRLYDVITRPIQGTRPRLVPGNECGVGGQVR